MDCLMTNNVVYLTGRVAEEPRYSHQVFGEGFYETKVEVERLSGLVDVIPVTVSERLLGEGDFEEGKYVSVSGQFRSYNKIADGKSRLMLTVFVRETNEDLPPNTNKIELIGYVCKPPVYRTTPFKREIADVLIAVNRAYNKSDYIPCIAWGRNARFAEKLVVGDKVGLSGRIQSREYRKTDENGVESVRVAYEISVNRLSYADATDTEEH